jgi:hypothetical protein
MIPNNIISTSGSTTTVNEVKLTGKAVAIVPVTNRATVADIQAVLNKLPKSAEVIDIYLEVVNHPGDETKIDVQITVEYESTETVANSLTEPVYRHGIEATVTNPTDTKVAR